ncbi:MAG: argininosuccinate synthase [Deltaproteobacteria bacterium]|nr:argininosuccinate synthase [Deltaproteobacteria bacterium]
MNNKNSKVNKVVLAYSGGLDTSIIIKWLMDKYQCQVICLAADLGQEEDLQKIKDKALRIGATKVYVEDLCQEFLTRYCFPSLWANAVYEGKYPLATALGRPLIAEKLVEIAEKEGADAVVHGSTGKGNDQVRFDVSIMALNSELQIIAPVREWEFKSREEEIDYAKKYDIPVPVTKEKPYSIDMNLWGVSIECGVLEDPWVEPPQDAYLITQSPQKAPQKSLDLELTFEEGNPVAIDGKPYKPVDLLKKLNQLGGAYGIGRFDMVENRLVGIKSREIYEAPGATILLTAHKELESLVLDRETMHFKEGIATKYAELVYYGLWHSKFREALDGFSKVLQKQVTGQVRMKLHPGYCLCVGRKSAFSLYNEDLATYTQRDIFDHKGGEYFCKLWGLPLKLSAQNKIKKSKK